MQAKNKDGSFGHPEEYNREKLTELLQDPNVKEVKIYPDTPENNAKAMKRFAVGKRFQKSPKK